MGTELSARHVDAGATRRSESRLRDLGVAVWSGNSVVLRFYSDRASCAIYLVGYHANEPRAPRARTRSGLAGDAYVAHSVGIIARRAYLAEPGSICTGSVAIGDGLTFGWSVKSTE